MTTLSGLKRLTCFLAAIVMLTGICGGFGALAEEDPAEQDWGIFDSLWNLLSADALQNAYRLFSGDADAVNSYHGSYMSSYSWASLTECYLSWKVFGGELRRGNDGDGSDRSHSLDKN